MMYIMRNATICVILFFIVFCELSMTAPVKATSYPPYRANKGKSHVKGRENLNFTTIIDKARPFVNHTAVRHLPAPTPCRRQTFLATLASLNLSHFFTAPRTPIMFAYCDGSCDPPYSLDARVRDYVTHDVLLRQMADLKTTSISDDKKKKFKSPCCVPVEYTGMWMTRRTTNGGKREYWSKAIPSRCGCR